MDRKSNSVGLKKEKKCKNIINTKKEKKKQTNKDRDQLLGGNGKTYTEQM